MMTQRSATASMMSKECVLCLMFIFPIISNGKHIQDLTKPNSTRSQTETQIVLNLPTNPKPLPSITETIPVNKPGQNVQSTTADPKGTTLKDESGQVNVSDDTVFPGLTTGLAVVIVLAVGFLIYFFIKRRGKMTRINTHGDHLQRKRFGPDAPLLSGEGATLDALVVVKDKATADIENSSMSPLHKLIMSQSNQLKKSLTDTAFINIKTSNGAEGIRWSLDGSQMGQSAYTSRKTGLGHEGYRWSLDGVQLDKSSTGAIESIPFEDVQLVLLPSGTETSLPTSRTDLASKLGLRSISIEPIHNNGVEMLTEEAKLANGIGLSRKGREILSKTSLNSVSIDPLPNKRVEMLSKEGNIGMELAKRKYSRSASSARIMKLPDSATFLERQSSFIPTLASEVKGKEVQSITSSSRDISNPEIHKPSDKTFVRTLSKADRSLIGSKESIGIQNHGRTNSKQSLKSHPRQNGSNSELLRSIDSLKQIGKVKQTIDGGQPLNSNSKNNSVDRTSSQNKTRVRKSSSQSNEAQKTRRKSSSSRERNKISFSKVNLSKSETADSVQILLSKGTDNDAAGKTLENPEHQVDERSARKPSTESKLSIGSASGTPKFFLGRRPDSHAAESEMVVSRADKANTGVGLKRAKFRKKSGARPGALRKSSDSSEGKPNERATRKKSIARKKSDARTKSEARKKSDSSEGKPEDEANRKRSEARKSSDSSEGKPNKRATRKKSNARKKSEARKKSDSSEGKPEDYADRKRSEARKKSISKLRKKFDSKAKKYSLSSGLSRLNQPDLNKLGMVQMESVDGDEPATTFSRLQNRRKSAF